MNKYFALTATALSSLIALIGAAAISMPWTMTERFADSLEKPDFAIRWLLLGVLALFGGIAGAIKNARWYSVEKR